MVELPQATLRALFGCPREATMQAARGTGQEPRWSSAARAPPRADALMSAIFGLVNLDGRPADEHDLDLMGAALAAYGPDGGNIRVDGPVGLGQRLMRFTPEDEFEQQPVFSRDRRRVLVSDARIDNRPELIEEFGIPAAEALELPDSGLILRAWEKWGPDCACHLTGAYAFALYEIEDRSLFMARSPMGERALFYCETPRVFAFSSAPKGLFALPFVPREINRRSVVDFLLFSANEPGTSCFAGVSRLQAGHSIVVRDGKSRSRQFRGIDLQRKIRFPRDRDYAEAFNVLLDRVIADQLRSRTPVGIWLSGGLDSTTLAAAAALKLGQEGKRLHTFTAVPPAGFSGALRKGWYADETPFVRAMARMYENLDTHFIVPDKRFFLDHLPPLLAASESPPLGAIHLNWVRPLQEEARRLNARVLLNGTPGNFTISYDGQSLVSQLVRQGKWIQATRLARVFADPRTISNTIARTLGMGLMPLLPDSVWLAAKQLQEGRIPGPASPLFWNGISLHPEFARAQKAHERARDILQYFRPCTGPAARATLMLWRADRRADLRRGEEAMHGVQNRDVPADIRLVEFCLSIPDEQYLNAETSRWLIRRAGADRLPPEVRNNQMRGLQAPDWFESMVAGKTRLLEEMAALEASALATEMIDLARLRSLIQQIPARQDGSERLLRNYRGAFESGIAVGRFLRWVESGV